MTVNKLDVSEGLNWFACGWKLFVKSWPMWVLVGLIYFAISMAFGLLGLIGGTVFALITPMLSAGFYFGAQQIQGGRELEVGTLFAGFRDQKRRGPLLILGLLWLAGTLLSVLVIALGVGIPLLTGLASGGDATATPAFGIGAMLGSLAGLLILLFVLMGIFYAIPLVALDGVAPVNAVGASIRACFKNWLPLLVFGIAYVVLAVLAALPLFLGFLVLMPLTFLAGYCSYRSVFAQ